MEVRNVMIHTKQVSMMTPPKYEKVSIDTNSFKSKLKFKLREALINFMVKHKMIQHRLDYKDIAEFSSVTIHTERLWDSISHLYDEYRYRGIEVSQIIVGRTTYQQYVSEQNAFDRPVFLDPISSYNVPVTFMGLPVILHPLIEGVVLVPKR